MTNGLVINFALIKLCRSLFFLLYSRRCHPSSMASVKTHTLSKKHAQHRSLEESEATSSLRSHGWWARMGRGTRTTMSRGTARGSNHLRPHQSPQKKKRCSTQGQSLQSGTSPSLFCWPALSLLCLPVSCLPVSSQSVPGLCFPVLGLWLPVLTRLPICSLPPPSVLSLSHSSLSSIPPLPVPGRPRLPVLSLSPLPVFSLSRPPVPSFSRLPVSSLSRLPILGLSNPSVPRSPPLPVLSLLRRPVLSLLRHWGKSLFVSHLASTLTRYVSTSAQPLASTSVQPPMSASAQSVTSTSAQPSASASAYEGNGLGKRKRTATVLTNIEEGEGEEDIQYLRRLSPEFKRHRHESPVDIVRTFVRVFLRVFLMSIDSRLGWRWNRF